MKEDSNWGENSIKVRIKKEWDKFKPLTPKEKLQYFMAYYFKLTLVLVIVIAAAITIAVTMLTNKDPVITGAFLNVTADDEISDYLGEDFFDYLDLENAAGLEAHFNGTYTVQFDNDLDYNNKMVFTTMIQGNALDYVLCNEDSISNMYNMGSCVDLNRALSEEHLEKYKDDIYYTEENGKEYPIAIKLTGLKMAEEYNMSDDTIYFVPLQGDGGSVNEYFDELLDYITE